MSNNNSFTEADKIMFNVLMQNKVSSEIKANKIAHMLDHGGNLNARTPNGGSLLMSAVSIGDKEVVKMLLERGVDTTCKDNDGWTALMYASINLNEEMVEMLIEKGGNIGKMKPKAAMSLARNQGLEDVEAFLESRDEDLYIGDNANDLSKKDKALKIESMIKNAMKNVGGLSLGGEGR